MKDAANKLYLDLMSLVVESTDANHFLDNFAALACTLLDARAIFVWLANKSTGRYELKVRCASPELAVLVPGGHWLDQDTVRRMPLGVAFAPGYSLSWADNRVPRLTSVLHGFDQHLGIVEVQFSPDASPDGDRVRLTSDLVGRASRALERIRTSQMVQALIDALSSVAEADSLEALQKCLLEGAFNITGCRIGSVLHLDNDTGTLKIARAEPAGDSTIELSVEKGVTGQCLNKLEPQRLPDVSQHKFFKPYWPGIRSELAIPLYIPKARIRVPSASGPGTELAEGEKPIGVLNVESPLADAFSSLEAQYLSRLAAAASVMIDRLQFDETLRRLHAAESELAQHLAGGHDWLDVIQTVGRHIYTTLAYSHVNISIVSADGKRIKSEYVWWDRSEEDKAKFKELSDHDVSTSKDIQADVFQNKRIEIPGPNDPRFHPQIHHQFGFDTLIRVYIPMTMGDVVVGTLEAGYKRKFRRYIFERDVQILKALGDYAAAAIWKKRRGQLDVLRHEIAAPRQAIMDNADFLQRRWPTLTPEKIQRKLGDIFLDGEVIDSQLDKIEYYITGRPKETKAEFCNVGIAVIMKTIFQQNQVLRSLGLDLSRIEYSRDELGKVKTVADKVKTSEVFNNLFGNAIKHRESDESLHIRITVDAEPGQYLIRIADRGIGIDSGCETLIFEEGFRAPRAQARTQGSGLGLWLARQYMRDMGGDVTLEKTRNPTTFCVRLIRKEQL